MHSSSVRRIAFSKRDNVGCEVNACPCIGELGSFLRNYEGLDFFALVNEKLRQLDGVLPSYACVSAEGLSDNGDRLHFNAKSLREFGIRYAETYFRLTGKKGRTAGCCGDCRF